MAKDKKTVLGRRGFLKAATATGAAALVPPAVVQAQAVPAAQSVRASRPSEAAVAAETGLGAPAPADLMINERPGSDFMVDVIKALGFEYCCANPGSSFRALHESIINYGGNRMPELITCCHEESSVAMAHGYFKIEGKPLMVMAHGTVGLQHASMAIYNAYCDRVPVFIVLGNILDMAYRRGNVEWVHSVQDAAAMVRDFTKWDDMPVTLEHFAESAVHGYRIAMTPPAEPVVLIADGKLQEEPIAEKNLRVPKLSLASPPQGDSGSVAECARMLVAAENPVLVAGRAARTANGVKLLVELAEALQAPVVDQRARMNFPSKHPLYAASFNMAGADMILGLEIQDFWSVLNQQTPLNRLGMESKPVIKPGTKVASISVLPLSHKSNYQDFGRYEEVDIAMAADAEATLPALIEAVKKLITGDRRRVFQERGAKQAEAHRRAREVSRQEATHAWNASPISTARLSAEIWEQVKNEDWSLVSNIRNYMSDWPTRLWDFEKPYHYIGQQGGAGIGYQAPAAVGAALANRKYGRLSVNINCDGDMNYAPSVLWTAAHHRIPLLTVMHNNRAYHQEVMQIQLMANRANRGVDRAGIGTAITDPNIDYATMAKAYGMYGEGPIMKSADLAPALKRAIAVVKRGEPALVDVVTQPR
ncbi:MAG TPA: thiamine pyrophosphate-dependent enzyme [Terriglobia bacterium]|nr:thiamine pyrophosphate-dependent enzyme [Terriglobia bacterium]